MQAQTTRTFNRNVQKLAGGLLIAAALAAGAVGLTTVGNLQIPGTGSSTSSGATNPVVRYTAVNAGEGLVDRSSLAIEAAPQFRVTAHIDPMAGEGRLEADSTVNGPVIAHLGEHQGDGLVDLSH